MWPREQIIVPEKVPDDNSGLIFTGLTIGTALWFVRRKWNARNVGQIVQADLLPASPAFKTSSYKTSSFQLQLRKKTVDVSKIVFPVKCRLNESLDSFWTISPVDPEKCEPWDKTSDIIRLIKQICPESQSLDHDKINEALAPFNLKTTNIKLMDERIKVELPEKRMPLFSDHTFLYVRHGVTDWNRNVFLTQGPLDLPLNDQGIEDVKQAIEDIESHKASVIAAAPSRRTIETKELIISLINSLWIYLKTNTRVYCVR